MFTSLQSVLDGLLALQVTFLAHAFATVADVRF